MNTKLHQSISFLEPGSTVALVCPGSICLSLGHPEVTRNYLKSKYQLNAKISQETTKSFSPKDRANFFLEQLFDEKINLIGILRGGEGCADILPYIHVYQKEIAKLKAKWLLGFSDFTALLIYFAQCYRWPVIHGASLLQFAEKRVDKNTEDITFNFLFGKNTRVYLEDLIPLNLAAKEERTLAGELTGGCLSLIDISIKDLWEIDTSNKIIFLEDVGEKAHKIIRNLKYLERISKFDQIKALILGDFSCQLIGCGEEEQKNNHAQILKTINNFASYHHFPVLYTRSIGHGFVNLPIVFCKNYQLQLGSTPKLILNESS